jgi:hypothetical protein
LPVPTLRIEEEALGLPRQPVPLRLACLVTGLTCADFGYLLAEIQAGGQPYLSAYEYRPDDAPRLVPPDHLSGPHPPKQRVPLLASPTRHLSKPQVPGIAWQRRERSLKHRLTDRS